MTPDAALGEQPARRVLAAALDRLDRRAPEDRTNAVRIPIDESTAPEIFRPDSNADRDLAWHVLDVLAADGIGTVKPRKAARHGARHERLPVFEISTDPLVEERLRTFYGRPRPGPKYSALWRAAVEASDLEGGARQAVAELPIAIEGRPAADVVARLLSIREIAARPGTTYLREVSSEAFWGLSKILDLRTDLVAALLGLPECPFPAYPVHLDVYFAGAFSWILFVENRTSYERAIRDAASAIRDGRASPYAGAALIFSGGYMGASANIRLRHAVRMFYSLDDVSDAAEVAGFASAFHDGAATETAFWGDLDHAGMAILSSLRTSFPAAAAWRPGYGPMLAKLEAGEGHAPEESGKTGQKPIARTGCPYADGVLIPAMARHGKFVDQE